MAHLQKYTKSVMGHMFNHYGRSELSPEDYVVRSNANIDQARIKLNYNLAEHQTLEQMSFIKQRLSEVKVQNRKDVNVFCDWVLTVPKDLPQEEHSLFFKQSYKFLEDRYGKENVISAYVHMDETTPHMHFAFVPAVKDRKKGGYKVSAKELITRADLQTFHNDLSNHLEREMGHPVSVLNEATQEGNRSIEELKRQSAKERLMEVTEETSKIVSKAKNEVIDVETSLILLNGEYEAKRAYIRACDVASDVSVTLPDYAKVKRSLLGTKESVTIPLDKWEQRHISANEKHYLENATKKFEQSLSDFKRRSSVKYVRELEQKVDNLEHELLITRNENNTLRSKVRKAEKEVGEIISKVKQVLDRLPSETAISFIEKWNTFKHYQSRDKSI